MKDQSWIADLLAGYKQLIDGNGNPVERRPTLALDSGFSVADDATNKVTRLIANASPLTETTADYVQPVVGSSVVVSVVSNATIAVGLGAFVVTGGMYQVTNVNVDGVHITLKNNGDAGNASPGTTITHPQKVIAAAEGTSGPPGPAPPGVGPIVNQVSATPIALSAAEGQAAVMAGGIPAAVGVFQAINVKSYGALGNGVHDDLAAIMAGIADATAQKKKLYFPAGTYLVNGEIHLSAITASMQGDLDAFDQVSVRIKAGSTARSVVCVENGPLHAEGIIFDANRFCLHAVLHLSAAFSDYKRCLFSNALLGGDTLSDTRIPVTVSAVTQTGPGPAITVVQNDPTFATLLDTNYVLKIDSFVSGVPQIKVSLDGGSTYSLAVQALVNGAHLNRLSTTSVAGFPGIGTDTGLILGTAAGTYQVGTTYAFSTTQPLFNHCVNDSIQYTNCAWTGNGTTYVTAGLAGNYTGELNIVTIAGTVTTQINNQIVEGTGTSFLSYDIREGDGFVVGGKAYKIFAVLDDTHLAIDVFPDTPLANLTNVDFAIGHGAGHREQLASDSSNTRVLSGYSRSNPIGMRYCGPFGFTEDTLQVDGQTVFSRMVGGSGQGVTRANFMTPYTENAPPACAQFYLGTGVQECVIVGPNISSSDVVNGGGTCHMFESGRFIGFNGATASVPIGVHSYSNQSVNVTSGSTLTAPDATTTGITGSFYTIRASGDFVWNNPIASGNQVGDIAIIDMASPYDIILTDRGIGGTLALPVPYVNLSYLESVTLRWNGVVWEFVGKSKNFQINGSSQFFNKIQTSDASAHAVYKWPKNHGWTPGFVAECDVVASEAGTNGVNQGAWLGVRLVWDGFGNNLISGAAGYTTDLITGTATGAPPFSWTLTVTSDSNFVYLNAIGDGAHTVNWKCYNEKTLSGAY